MYIPSSVTLCEVGLRDGLQNEKTLISTAEKLSMLRSLIDAGFPVIEVGSFMHPKAVPQMADTDELFREIGDVPNVELRALIPNVRGVQRAIDCGCKKVKLNVSASRQHNLHNLNMTPEQSVAGFVSCVELAQANGIAISGSISMPFASPWEGRTPVEDVDAIIEAYLSVGIDEISLSDASGMAVPNQVRALCAAASAAARLFQEPQATSHLRTLSTCATNPLSRPAWMSLRSWLFPVICVSCWAVTWKAMFSVPAVPVTCSQKTRADDFALNLLPKTIERLYAIIDIPFLTITPKMQYYVYNFLCLFSRNAKKVVL